MANIKSAKKRIKVNERNAMRNQIFKSMLKTAIKKVVQGKSENKETDLRSALSYLDRAVSKGILKRNTVARKKSLVMKRYNQAN